MFARPFIDSIDFARNGRELHGEIPIVDLPRLSDMLANSAGTLSYRVRGSQRDDRHSLEIVLQGTCNLRCQRCLGEFSYPLELTAHLRLLPADKLEQMDADDEDAIEATSQLDVLALIEDEVLLALPFAPKHPQEACSAPLKDLQQSANPFSVLAVLKK
jgi:uncharacterized protein